MKKVLAFTLAETLIVMGIIGVVSALTLPNLNSSTGEKEKIAKVKKIYQNLNDAVGRAQAVYGPFNEWFVSDTNMTAQTTRAGGRITEFMKISKNCEVDFSKYCFNKVGAKLRNGGSHEYDNLDGNTTASTSPYRFITADQTSISIGHGGNVDPDMVIFVCLKGNSCTGRMGNDLFIFSLSKEGSVVPWGQNSTDTLIQNNCLKKSSTGDSCAAWVIQTDNMDYLKADDSGKCPNGTVLSWTNTTCK